MTKGIDVSVHQGDIDWEKVKSDSVEFAILRAGYGRDFSQKDAKFEKNYEFRKRMRCVHRKDVRDFITKKSENEFDEKRQSK